MNAHAVRECRRRARCWRGGSDWTGRTVRRAQSGFYKGLGVPLVRAGIDALAGGATGATATGEA